MFMFILIEYFFFKYCVLDSDTSDYEPLLLCACCNQCAEELINCTRCERFYHNECHIPPISKDFKPKEYFIF